MQAPEVDAAHWRKTRNLAVSVLAVGLIAGLCVFWYLLPLGGDAKMASGAPATMRVAYWYAAQGVLILFVLLAFYLNWRQDGIDRDYGEDD